MPEKNSKTRRRKRPEYHSFKLSKSIKHPQKLDPASRIMRDSLRHLLANWKFYGAIVLIYALLIVFLVRGLGGNQNLSDLKSNLESSGYSQSSQLANGVALFGILLSGTGGTGSEAGAAYQSVLLIVGSLAMVWALRQKHAATSTDGLRARDAYYKGMCPLIPFTLVMLVMALQLLPLVLGASIYSVVLTGGVAVTVLEKVLWSILFALAALLSLYMLASSVFALYIVTLSDMTPLKALRSARQLVRNRRWTILRKILFLPFSLLLVSAVIMLPVIIWLTAIGEILFFVLSVIGLLIVHAYMYELYRRLIDE